MTEETIRYYIGDIIEQASVVFGLHPDHIVSSDRSRSRFIVRAAIAHLARELTHLSLPEIGRRLGGRDHSTVGHAIERAHELMATSPDYALMVAEIEARVTARPANAIMLAELRLERRAKAEQMAAERERQAAAERARLDHWNSKAGGNVSYAAKLHKREKRIEALPCAAKPRNNFFAGADDHDDAHEFHARMAEGSARLRDAILAA